MRQLRAAGAVVTLALAAALPVWALAQTAPPQPVTPAPQAQPSPLPTPATDPANPTQSSPDQPSPAPADPASQEVGADNASLELVRKSDKDGKERRIRIVKTGTTDETGIFTFCNPRDDDPEGTPTTAVFSETGPGGIRITIDKNVIRVPLAVVTQQPPKDGEDGSDGRVEASAGTARFLIMARDQIDTALRLEPCLG